VFEQSIVATDYDTYAVVIFCNPTFNSETKEFGRDMIANIYARGKTMSEDTLKTLKSIVTSYDVEYNSMKKVAHDC
jgi:Lipocalin / cytosolic fatty-acid binding protein family